MTDIDPALIEARRQRALRWAASDLRGYPTLAAEQETEQTLAAEPPVPEAKKAKGTVSEHGST